MPDQTFTFKKSKETKGAVQFEEVVEDGEAVVRTLYLRKFSELSKAETLTVTIATA